MGDSLRSGERQAVEPHRSDMAPLRFRGLPTAEVLGVEVRVATGLIARLLGLASLSRSRAGHGLLIPRCRSVHTFGMRFDLDIYFLDERNRILRRHPAVPRRRILACTGAKAVLELPATTSVARASRVPLTGPQKEKELT
jgi:uncharacterized membrane protein (UPF0127 family)